MNTTTYGVSTCKPPPHRHSRGPRQIRFAKPRRLTLSLQSGPNIHHQAAERSDGTTCNRRAALLVPQLLVAAACFFGPPLSSAAEESSSSAATTSTVADTPTPAVVASATEEESIASRIYDATAIGEPMAVGKDKRKVWDKLMNARVVYLGEAEQVPTRDDKVVELEIVRSLRRRCVESERQLSLAMEAFPCDVQEQVNQYIDKRIDGVTLKSYVPHWPDQRWQEYEPLLSYCQNNAIRLVALGTPLKILRTVQAEGIRGLSKSERKIYAPPAGSGFISGFTSISRRSLVDINSPTQNVPFGPSSYLSAQARVVEEYSMSQIILQSLAVGGTSLLVVVTGANHVQYGPRGTGLPARISKKMQKKNQVVILLDPERQSIRREGEAPVADFLWYSAARPCSRNCFDRAEIARVMNAAGRRRDALPQDLQKGLDLGLVSPEVLQNFFDVEQYPFVSELTQRFQGFRERLLADPKFLTRLAIEESISLTTTLIAQYEKRRENFLEEIDYVITDTVRGAVVDFFTVWLPAPTLSFLSYADETNMPDSMDALQGLLGSIPDNAFQKNLGGREWNISHRIVSVLVGGLKLGGVGFISSIGAVAVSNILYAMRKLISPELIADQKTNRSPILKTAVVYSSFLGTSANLRYQVIAGLIEHRLSDELSSQTLLVNMISFVVRVINSYWGTQQWIDLARFYGLQTRKSKSQSYESGDSSNHAAIECNSPEEAATDDVNKE